MSNKLKKRSVDTKDDNNQNFFHKQFEKKLSDFKENKAITHENLFITYDILNKKANFIARKLVALSTRKSIGVYLEKSIDTFVAFLAILKSGNIFVPIDTQMPNSRIDFIVEDAEIEAFICFKKDENLLIEFSQKLLIIDSTEFYKEFSQLENENLTLEEIGLKETDLAYIIYTSGSTGTPKGVMTEHKALATMGDSYKEAYKFSYPPTTLQMASSSFDVFIGDCIRTWLEGGNLVICPKEVFLEPEALHDFINYHKIDFAEFVPFVLRRYLEYLDQNHLKLASPRYSRHPIALQ